MLLTKPWLLVTALSIAVAGCGSDEAGSAGNPQLPSCATSKIAIVTDIDETLTTADEEFFQQLQDGTYDPLEREGASDLIRGYADRGYFIVYLTARAETLNLAGTNETARQGTERWLTEHDFPLTRSDVVLASEVVFGDAARQYKAAALQSRQTDDFSFDYAYGNADSDVRAYADAGIPKDVTFIIGELAGFEETVAVAGEGWTAHAEEQLPKVQPVCQLEP
jgi:phosphatidate phosphatase PAH1